MDVFKTAQKANIRLGYFCKKNCHQELSKIAQSGHTAGMVVNPWRNFMYILWAIFLTRASHLMRFQ